jgi:hypothetical protein
LHHTGYIIFEESENAGGCNELVVRTARTKKSIKRGEF